MYCSQCAIWRQALNEEHFHGKLLVELGREGILDSDGQEAVYEAIEPRVAKSVGLLWMPWYHLVCLSGITTMLPLQVLLGPDLLFPVRTFHAP